MDLNNHPCFNEGVCGTYGRIHLPVAPLCNIQCNFCNRKYDCVNESRPGVTSGVLSPYQAIGYLESILSERSNISVVGIAGPGDPFANPDETLKTLDLVRKGFPDVILCVATNGLNLLPYADRIIDLRVSHISITVNAVDPDIGADIYAWIRNGKRAMPAREGAGMLLENQLKAISYLKARGMIVKINSVVIPGINDFHVPDVAKRMGEMGVDLFNCMPYCPSPGSRFAHLGEPSPFTVGRIREQAARHVKQMRHCTHCRADAVGLLNEAPDQGVMERLRSYASSSKVKPLGGAPERPYVAVASLEGALINQHLGEASRLLIYGIKDGGVSLLDIRETPEPGSGDERWEELSRIIKDCRAVLVGGAGAKPKNILSKNGLEIHEMEGIIEDAVCAVLAGDALNGFVKRRMTGCNGECSGNGMGCG